MTRIPDEPIDDLVPIPDAVEQRIEVDEAPNLSETFAPTEASEIAAQEAPVDADPADWQEQHTSPGGSDDWDDRQ